MTQMKKVFFKNKPNMLINSVIEYIYIYKDDF